MALFRSIASRRFRASRDTTGPFIRSPAKKAPWVVVPWGWLPVKAARKSTIFPEGSRLSLQVFVIIIYILQIFDTVKKNLQIFEKKSDTIHMIEMWTRIEQIMFENKYTFRKLADEIGVGESTVSMWRTNGTIPRADDAVKIAKFLETTVEYLITGEYEGGLTQEQREMIQQYYVLDEREKQIVQDLINSMYERMWEAWRKNHLIDSSEHISVSDDWGITPAPALEAIRNVPGKGRPSKAKPEAADTKKNAKTKK
jgi:transcriptional regulator with XRE-family HTH domain